MVGCVKRVGSGEWLVSLKCDDPLSDCVERARA
jgi:hypothetical protein